MFLATGSRHSDVTSDLGFSKSSLLYPPIMATRDTDSLQRAKQRREHQYFKLVV